MKLIENNDLTKIDISQAGIDVVEENVRRSKVKEIKQAKELLENKLINIDEQIQQLIFDENNATKQSKKFDLKQYLENFEKDQKEAEKKTQQYQKDKDEFKKKIEDLHIKEEIKKKQQKEINEKENEEKAVKKHEEYLKKIELMKLKGKDKHEEVEKLKDEWKSKIVEKNYKYLTAEEDFKNKQEKLEEERKNKFLEDIIKKRNTILKPIKKEELNEFSKKVTEERQKKLYEKEKERLLKQEEIMNLNTQLPKSETQAYKQIVEEDKKFKNFKEKDKLDKLYTQLKVKNYSKEVNNMMLPDIDENKKKEREERINNIHNKQVKKLKRKRGQRVLIVKPKNSNNLSLSQRSLNVSKNKSIMRSQSLDESEKYDYNEIKNRLYKSRSQEKRKPMEKNPDYLTAMRKQKEKKDKGNTEHENQDKLSKDFII
jgi:hypothetical protein